MKNKTLILLLSNIILLIFLYWAISNFVFSINLNQPVYQNSTYSDYSGSDIVAIGTGNSVEVTVYRPWIFPDRWYGSIYESAGNYGYVYIFNLLGFPLYYKNIDFSIYNKLFIVFLSMYISGIFSFKIFMKSEKVKGGKDE